MQTREVKPSEVEPSEVEPSKTEASPSAGASQPSAVPTDEFINADSIRAAVTAAARITHMTAALTAYNAPTSAVQLIAIVIAPIAALIRLNFI